MAAPIYLRGASGIWTIDGTSYKSTPTAEIDKSDSCKCLKFSDDGSVMAWCNAESAYILDTTTMKVMHDLRLERLSDIKFSPKGNVLATWTNFVTSGSRQGELNMRFVDVKSGAVKNSLIHKKQGNWAPEWSADEQVCVRNVNNELHFYEDNNFGTIANRLHIQKVSAFSIAASSAPYIIAASVTGAKGQPSFVRIYQYPNLGGPQSALASKSFFKADRVNFFWNKKGNSLLVLTSTESSDSSYYGEQNLHFMATNGESCFVPQQKNGPIYHVEWAPNNTEFVVVHGYMPANTTIYNLRCEPKFDFGTGPRNVCYFNPQGNILCLAGFGNLSGNLEFWDIHQKKLISQTKAMDTTHFEWAPDGQHVLTATLTPRLRIGNGYRVWHYSGTLMMEHPLPDNSALLQASWLPQPVDRFPRFTISAKPVESAVAEQPKVKAMAYVPPQARGQTAPQLVQPLQEYQPPSNVRNKEAEKGMSKSQKKKARAAQRDASQLSQPPPPPTAAATSTGDPEKDKRRKNLRKKVKQIEKLVEQQAAGTVLEASQLGKIGMLDSLRKEIEELEAS